MKTRIFLIFAIIYLSIIADAQTAQGQSYQSNKIIPPSPTTAALGSYGNIPVSLYNGTPNIAIPLYDISTSNHSVKIVLNYDASGIKVSQDASWVGLGWSLSAGGMVSRIIRQQDDFIEHDYYYAATLPTSAIMSTQAGKDYTDGIYKGTLDAEPDIYSYNFNGIAGRFVLGKSADGSPVFMDEKNNLDIQYVSGGWVFITGEGYKYYFSTAERAQDYNRSASFEMPAFTGVTGLNMSLDNILPITGWYLDSIVAPTAEAVRFSYVKGKSLSLINYSETYCVLDKIIGGYCSTNTPSTPNLQNGYHSYDVGRQVLTNIYLQKISFSNGSVEFNTTGRSDIEYLNTSDGLLLPSKLDNIVVKNENGSQLKKFSFYYSYFNSASISGRLKLDSVIEAGTNQQQKPPYKFTYNNPNSLPDKYSKSIDHWGYYNGLNNYTLLPTTTIPDAPQSFNGADRSPDISHNYPLNGILTTITYPTGGSTTFEYELNDYSNLRGDQKYVSVNHSAFVRANPDIHQQDDETTATFVLPPNPDVTDGKVPVIIQCSYQKVDASVSDLVSLGYSNMWKVLPNNQLQSVAGCTTANYNQTNPSPTETNKNLDPGTYKIMVQSTKGWSFYMSVSWSEKVLVTEDQRKGGGIRIKSITDKDINGDAAIRKYIYTGNNGKSSGILLGYPKYDGSYEYGQYVFITPPDGPGGICEFTGLYTQITSNSIYPTGLSSKSGIVGYSKVTELLGANGENGKTEYFYNNAEEYVDDFPGIPTVSNPLNGKLDSVLQYNASGACLKKSTYTYQIKENNSIQGLKLFTSPILQGDGNLGHVKKQIIQYLA
jgi:hypothetical protein